MIEINSTKELSSWDIQSLINEDLKASLLENMILIDVDGADMKQLNAFRAWTQINIRGHWHLEEAHFPEGKTATYPSSRESRQFSMYFELEEDKLAFKLQWAG